MPSRGLGAGDLAALASELIRQANAKSAKHLTEEEFAEREGVSVQTAGIWRRDGTGPKYMPMSDSATKRTIRYRLVDIEEWEAGRLVDPKALATA
jgi:hypothetical protein